MVLYRRENFKRFTLNSFHTVMQRRCQSCLYLFVMVNATGIYGGEFLTPSQTFKQIFYYRPKFDVLKILYFLLILNKNIAVLTALF